MDDYIKRLRQYVEANPILFDGEWDHPAMDSLYWHYSESHYMGNEKTKKISRELNDRLEELSFRENNRVFSLVGSLCAEHERIAFFAGLQLGAQLICHLRSSRSRRLTVFQTCCPAWTLSAKKPPVLPSLDS